MIRNRLGKGVSKFCPPRKWRHLESGVFCIVQKMPHENKEERGEEYAKNDICQDGKIFARSK